MLLHVLGREVARPVPFGRQADDGDRPARSQDAAKGRDVVGHAAQRRRARVAGRADLTRNARAGSKRLGRVLSVGGRSRHRSNACGRASARSARRRRRRLVVRPVASRDGRDRRRLRDASRRAPSGSRGGAGRVGAERFGPSRSARSMRAASASALAAARRRARRQRRDDALLDPAIGDRRAQVRQTLRHRRSRAARLAQDARLAAFFRASASGRGCAGRGRSGPGWCRPRAGSPAAGPARIGDSHHGKAALVARMAAIQAIARRVWTPWRAAASRQRRRRVVARRRFPVEAPAGQGGEDELGVEEHPHRREQKRMDELDQGAREQACARRRSGAPRRARRARPARAPWARAAARRSGRTASASRRRWRSARSGTAGTAR